MNPEPITSAAQAEQLDAENRKNFLTNLSSEQTDPGAKARIDRKLANLNTGATGTTSAITSGDLAQVSPYYVPEAPVSTGAEGLSGMAGSVKESQVKANAIQADLEKSRQEAQSAKDSSKNDLKSLMGEYLGVTESRAQLEQEAGIDKKAQKVTDVTNQIEASERAQTNELRALESANLTDSGRATASRDINRKYAFEQADLALIQSAANRDLATAQSIVDRKIDLKLEPLKIKMDFTKMFYEENKDLFDKADQRAFENVIRQDERTYTEERDKVKSLEKAKLEAIVEAQTNGAPIEILNAIQRAETPESAFAAAGQYIGLLKRQDAALDREIKRLQADKLRGEISDNSPYTGLANDLSGILASNKIGQGTKTTIGTILGVVNAVKDMAEDNPDGKFTGFNPVAGFVNGAFNVILPGQPGKPSFLKRSETIQNETYLEGINLKIQQWASGAALTEAQTAQVARMTPRKGDTDRVVKEKLNQLTNFMQQQIKGALQAEGVAYEPEDVDLFLENKSLDEIFSDTTTTSPMLK